MFEVFISTIAIPPGVEEVGGYGTRGRQGTLYIGLNVRFYISVTDSYKLFLLPNMFLIEPLQ